MKQRLTALEKISAVQGLAFTELQVQALERKKQDDEALGELESHHPGSQDTFYAGTYSKWSTARLYTTKTPITGANPLNDRVFSFLCFTTNGSYPYPDGQGDGILRQAGNT